MKSKIHSAGKGKGGLHLTSPKAGASFGRTSVPDRPKNRPLSSGGTKGPKIALGKGNQGTASLRG